jgi:hypothetical protein
MATGQAWRNLRRASNASRGEEAESQSQAGDTEWTIAGVKITT